MALSRVQSTHTYSSSSGGAFYYFDVVVDARGLLSTRNIRTPQGALADSNTPLPQAVLNDIAIALETATILTQETEVDSGQISFEGDAEVAVSIAAGLLNNASYRVLFTTSGNTYLQAQNKTTSGFDAVASTILGSEETPTLVDYSVLVKTGQTSDLSGTLSITHADEGEASIVFTTPLPTSHYRVLLEPQGPFSAYVSRRTRAGFTVSLGFVPRDGSPVSVGYDIFV